MELRLSAEKKLYVPNTHKNTEKTFSENECSDPSSILLNFLDLSSSNSMNPSTSYWYEFVTAFMRDFCIHLENESSDRTLNPIVLEKFISCRLMIAGGEFVDADFLQKVWNDLYTKLWKAIQTSNKDPRQYLESKYPQWAQVGQVHFHIAESQKDATPFAFLASYTTRVSERTRIQHIPLARLLESDASFDKSKIETLLKPIQNAAAKAPFVQNLVNSGRIFQTCYFSASEAYKFFQDIDSCQSSGIVVKLPKSWEDKRPTRTKVQINLQNDAQQSLVGIHALFQLTAKVSVGGKVLSESELRALLDQGEDLILIDGKWVEFDRNKIQSLLDKWQKAIHLQNEGLSFGEAMRLLSKIAITKEDQDLFGAEESPWLDITTNEDFDDKLKTLRSDNFAIDVDAVLDASLNAKLRPYQAEGAHWLIRLSQMGLGACLADDMGLGKTLQILAVLTYEASKQGQHPSLLILPASLIGNWESEIKKFAPSLRYQIVHSSRLTAMQMQKFAEDYSSVDVVITTYSMLTRLSWLQKNAWNLLIIDEAQAIKNPNSQQSLAVKMISARIKIALTGTPIENSMSDLWSIFDFCCPGLLGTYPEFRKFNESMKKLESYSSLRNLIQPYLLRRKKSDKSVIDDLPEKTELKAFCLLAKAQIKLYRQTIKELSHDLKDNDGIARKGLILSYLLKFKQICNHPSQMLADNTYRYEDSGKFFRLKEITETIAARGEKVLVFTQFREMTDILSAFLTEIFGQPGLVLHGGTPVKKRQDLVKDFQRSDGPSFFVLSLKAGGTGLNLTNASHVIHFDRWWNPAVEAQATDRAFRIGQKKNVIVHKFICQGTIEEKIDEMIESKMSLAENVVEANESIKWTELSDAELMTLVALNLNTAELS